MNKEMITRYFEDHKEEYLRDLKRLIDINSTADPATAGPGKPYGEGPAKALETALEIAKGYGLHTFNGEHYGLVWLESDGTDDPGARRMDVLGHLDVVPATPESWTTTHPYDMKIIDGTAYGRGVADDKGPSLAAVYALRAVNELAPGAVKGIRVFLGTCEETGGEDTQIYFKQYGEPEMAVTPDANWPVVNIEKGGMMGRISDTVTDNGGRARICSFAGGKAANIICGHTEAVIEGIDEAAARAEAEKVTQATGVVVSVAAGAGAGQLCVTAEGHSAHASTPDLGNNSNTAMLQFLASLPFDDAKIVSDIRTLAEMFPHGDTCGRAAGNYLSDAISGETTCCLDILKFDGTEFTAVFDARLPVCADDENTAVPGDRVRAAGMRFEGRRRPAHHVPEESDFVQNLLAAYEAFTGEKGRCLAIGGGTYCHELAGGVAYGFERFGADYHMHGDDEYIPVSELMTGCAIYTDMYMRLCGKQ